MPAPTRHARLERVKDLSSATRSFHLRVEGKDPFTFLPGQWISIHIPHEGKKLTRGYSIASSPGPEPRFELCVKHVASGPASAYLWSLKPGDRVGFSGPFGRFLLREPIERGAVFVATGTGISPFRAMLRQALPRSDRHPMTLLFGARSQPDLLYRQEWESLERAYPNFRFLPTLSRPEPGWSGRRGYVTDATPDLLTPRRDVDVYICGLRRMVSAVNDQCLQWGYPKERIHTERYD